MNMNSIKKRILFVATVLTSIVYVIWRTFFTLPFQFGAVAMFFGVLLLLAELIGFLEASNIYRGMVKTHEPECPVIPEELFPHVDVLIATYNEPVDLLEKTINGCLQMDYPDKSKVHIYICDDGSRESMAALAERMGVSYIKREEHNHAKAGNYNHALSCTSSPLIATLDADMIPMHDFLTALVPYFFMDEFQKDEDGTWKKQDRKNPAHKVGFVQSPQSFYNADLFQYNLYSENTVPNEQDFFFRQVQLSRNINNAAIYGGSNTIISRKALEDVGGFYTNSITEDLATGMLIQNAGYQGFAVGSVHANGLSPTDLKSLLKQRDRWARGCIQTVKRLNLLGLKGLSVSQKITYFFTALYWYTPLRRCIFILAPILYAVFNIPLLQCTLAGILTFWLPQIILYNLALSHLTGKIRTARLSNIYDTIMFPYLLPGVILETFGVTMSNFSVTSKEKNNGGNEWRFAVKSAAVHVILILLSVIGIVRCLMASVQDQTPAYLVILFWLIANGYNLAMALFFMLGRAAYRSSDRFNIAEEITLRFDGQSLTTVTSDMSEGGTAIVLDFPYYVPDDRDITVEIKNQSGRYHATLSARVVYIRKGRNGWRYAFKFTDLEEQERYQLYGILYDRVACGPAYVTSDSSFFEDMRVNVHKRMKKDVFSNLRRLPRIDLDVQLQTEDQQTVVMKNFNYRYLLLQTSLREDTLKLTYGDQSSVFFLCKKVEQQMQRNTDMQLYEVENFQSFAYDPAFLRLLGDWSQTFDGAQQLRDTALMSLKKDVYKDEFTDIQYISTESEPQKTSTTAGE